MRTRLLSWPGAKYRQLDDLLKWVPHNYPDNMAICEPFWGTGAFTMSLVENISAPVFIAEANQPLRNWWNWMMNDQSGLIDRMMHYRQHFIDAGKDRSVYDAMRDGWNKQKIVQPDHIDTAAWLWCLVYQSTNNLARFNSKGHYNQTWGQGRKVPDPEAVYGDIERQSLSFLSTAVAAGCLEKDCFLALDKFMDYVDGGGDGMCYLDPPYIVQTETYDKNCWERRHVDKLMNYLEGLESRNIPWLMTEYMSKGDKTHPYGNSLHAHYTVLPLDRKMDARPTGEQLPTQEVVILGSWIGEQQFVGDECDTCAEPERLQGTLFR